MEFPVQTTVTWSGAPENTDLSMEVSEWINKAIEAGKTQYTLGIPVNDQPNSFIRYWKDSIAANEWESFITALASKYGLTVVVTTA